MAKQIKAKIPKLKEADRVKIIDRPDILAVQPITHVASIRYGHKSSWCTATGNVKEFEKHSAKEILIYIIIYTLDEKGKRNGEKTKIAISKPKRIRTINKITCYDRFDATINIELVKTIIGSDDFETILNYLKIGVVRSKPQKLRQNTSEFKIGDLVKCLGKRRLKIKYFEFEEERWKIHLTKGRGWQKALYYKESNFSNFSFKLSIKKGDIKKAKVVNVNSSSITIELIEVANINEIKAKLIKDYKISLRINMTTKTEVKVLSE